GAIVLRPGASVAGWIATEDRTPLPSKTEAVLLPSIGPGQADHDLTERLQRPAASAAVRHDGFFQLVDVPPATYVLEARSPGFAAGHVPSVTVSAGAESWLQAALVLRRPLDVVF